MTNSARLEKTLRQTAILYAAITCLIGGLMAAGVATGMNDPLLQPEHPVIAGCIAFAIVGLVPGYLVYTHFSKRVDLLRALIRSGQRFDAQLTRSTIEQVALAMFGARNIRVSWRDGSYEYRTEIVAPPRFRHADSVELVASKNAKRVLILVGDQMFMGPKIVGKRLQVPHLRAGVI